MRELIRCWQHTRMIVLIGLSAALFVAVLLPFKIATIVPGITEIRPAAALPIIFSVFFGPAAAWGAAFGNTIGDVLGGTISPGTIFGFFGNFLYAYIPYRMMRAAGISINQPFNAQGWAIFLLSIVIASGFCGAIIAMGVDFAKIIPFQFLMHTIFLNNVLVSAVLAPILVRTLQKRVWQMKFSYTQIMNPEDISPPVLKFAGAFIATALLVIVYTMLVFPSLLPMTPQNTKLFELIASIILTLAALILF
jgi:energy-coupling factor transport system substrate-specific component